MKLVARAIDSAHDRHYPMANPCRRVGWVNRHQLEVMDFLREENRVLRGHLGGRRLRLTDAQRRGLAGHGHALGRSALMQVATLVTPATLLRWHRQLMAGKCTTARRPVGRPRVMREIRHLATRTRMARENPTWGYRRIQGALKNLDHHVARSTMRPSCARRASVPPERPMSWRTFLAAHWGAIVAADFFKVEPWRIYKVDDARAFLTDSGVDVDRLASEVEDRFASAFVRARKPQANSCCGPECCA